MRNVMMAVLAMVAVAAGQIPTTGLQARYDFTSGSLVDNSGNGRTLTSDGIGGTLTADRDLWPNNAYRFEGNISGYYYRSESGLPSGNSDRTVCFWLSLASIGDSVQQILAWGVPRSYRDTSMGFRLVVRGDSLCVQQRGVRFAKSKVTSTQFPANAGWNAPWRHVTIVTSADTAWWYVDGALHQRVSCAGLATSASASSYFLINGIGSRFLVGKLDEILIYNRALTPTEVHNIYIPQVSTIEHARPTMKTAASTAIRSFSLDGRLVQNRLTSACGFGSLRIISR